VQMECQPMWTTSMAVRGAAARKTKSMYPCHLCKRFTPLVEEDIGGEKYGGQKDRGQKDLPGTIFLSRTFLPML
jgi:hypothetical protein